MRESSYAVVIPTVGRPSLGAAVLSALTQYPRPAEIVVVVDGADAAAVPRYVAGFAEVRVITTGGGRGPSGSRMAGVRASRAPLVAFLDDDDEWLPGKMATQLRLFGSSRADVSHPVVSCRAYLVYDGRCAGQVAPTATPAEDQPLHDYMFHRRQVMPQGFMFGSSTILAPRALLELEPWDERLRLHEDWEWLLRVSDRSDVVVRMHADPLICYAKSSSGSHASRPRGGWRDSVEFAERVGLSGNSRGDFLLSAAAPNAILFGDRAEAVRIALEVRRTAGASARAWLVFALRLAVPDRLLRIAVASVRALRRTQRWTSDRIAAAWGRRPPAPAGTG